VPEWNVEHLARPRTRGAGVDVFAPEHTTAQVVWSDLPPGRHRLELRADLRSAGTPVVTEVETGGGPGSVLLDGLRSDQPYELALAGSTRRFRTVAPPPGEELFRFATVNDLHLGRGNRPYSGPLAHLGTHEHTAARSEPIDHQWLCASAAIDEAIEWGAQLIVVKGDVCEESYDWIWDQAAKLLGDLPVPVLMLPGNHDTGTRREFEPEVGASARGLHVVRGVEHHDVDGLRILLVDSTRNGSGWGTIARHGEEAAELAGEVDHGVFIATHHHAQRFTLPVFWPHGIPGRDANLFARRVASANPSALVSSGHTHRCRRRRVGGADGLEWTEVAATNHFPGVWGGYTVHEGGISQTVRRITRPEALGWTEHTRDVLAGVWALWATGTPSDRSFSLSW
jgi:3',5'-cyclic-AMP phosphodiesterase